MNTHHFRAAATLLMGLLFCVSVRAQTNPNLDEIGLKPYGSFEGGNIDSVALSNGNLNLKIPFFSYPQRGSLPGNLFLTYNGKNWWVFQHCNLGVCTDQWKYNYNSYADVHLNYDAPAKVSWQPLVPGQPSGYVYTANSSDGTPHLMMANNNGGEETADGSGIWYNGYNGLNGIPSPLLIDRSGRKSIPTTAPTFQDANGNQVTYPNNIFTDTLNRPLGSLGSSTTDYSGCVQPSAPHSISAAYISNYPGPNGTNRQIKSCRATYTLSTQFNATDPDGNPIQEGTASATFNVSFVIYNGSSWATSPAWGFDYQNSYGDLTKVTLPTGGTISYGWGNLPLCTSGTALAQVSRAVSSRTADVQDGTGPQTWVYAINTYFGSGPPISNMGTMVTDPFQNQTLHYMTQFGDCGYYENKTAWFQGSHPTGSLLKTQVTDYVHTTNPFVANLHPAPDVNVLPIRVTTTWPNGNTTKIETDHDANFHSNTYNFSHGEVTAVREYDYGTTANVPGPLLRTTTNAYYAASDSTYLAANLLDLMSSTIITNGAGTQIAKSTYAFDGYTLQSSGITTQRDTTVANPGKRGNLTSSCQWLNTTGGNICKYIHYFDTGMPYQVTDPLSNVTTYSYSPTYIGTYLTQTNMPNTGSPVVNHIVSGTYDFNTGSITSYTDQNSKISNYTYDPLGRISSATFPDGGQTSFIYTDTALNAHVERTQKITSSLSIDRFVYFDGLARTKQTQLADPDGTTFVDTTYDALGRVHSVSNPHRSGSSATDGITSYVYDILGRTCVVVPPDGAAVSGNNCPATQPANDVFTTYLGNTATVTDQAGKVRKSRNDGLGRLTSVWEDPAVLNYLTSYGYDALGNLTSVLQAGSRSRTFTYNSFSQLLTAVNPESGSITYTYDNNGNVLTKKDARNITTTYAYDALNRMTQKSYSDGTLTGYYNYDAPPAWMPDLTNTTGRLTVMNNSSAGLSDGRATSTTYSYDTMGRTLRTWQQTPSVSPGASFVYQSYDLAGDLTSATNAAGVVISYTYDSAARLKTVTSGWNDAQHPTTLYSVDPSVGYFPNGALRKATLPNGLTQTAMYNSRLQPCRLEINSTAAYFITACADAVPGGNVLDFTYGYNSGTSNNGNVASWSSVGNQTFNRSYLYDSLNRLKTLSDTATAQTCKGLSWTYDAWGNRSDQTTTAGTCGQLHAGVNTNNQLTDPVNNLYQYDAAGNMIHDSSHSYAYDAENRVTQVDAGATASYLYDPNGNRVTKKSASSWTDYYYDSFGNVTAEHNPTSWPVEYVYASGQLIAQYSGGTTYSIFKDHLGSTRLITKLDKTVFDFLDFMPFGEQLGGGTGTSYKFTAKERDSESGLDNFGARYNSSSVGRFITPDPLAGHTEDPQTFNRYSYVRNNPLNFTDPTGLDFFLSCAQNDRNKTTCQGGHAGTSTTDENGKTTFTPTVVTSASLSDPNSGNTGTVNENGVQITSNGQTSQGIFINGTDPASLQGSGKLSDFVFNIDGSDEKKGTLDSGSFTYTGSRDQADVVRVLNERGAFTYAAERAFGNKFHKGELNFRFTSGSYPNLFDYGPSPHLLVPQGPRATIPVGPGYTGGFHIDSHTGSVRHGACALEGIGCQ